MTFNTIEQKPVEEEINHEYTDEIVCPYCGNEHGDSWEFNSNEQGSLGLYECGNCGKEFYVCRDVSVTYSTTKATYGVCKRCGKSDVIIENKKGCPFPNYTELCPKCGQKEEKTQITAYFQELDKKHSL